ncbi:hypothetical protein COW36_02335 [bacterium (Candidatus Blackallbacteria) CG17_big_fil_post_rev_8_21_14_2_50_48_46]|uniref:histidine kinase n=1 Tax=bacterium (Candidatus Blackallbacteria) CG17_big_fil_post_rev_8_21_14_2_50_48_46 TaxID=2014261 RepID=A0A2M7GAL5_9BACT|nr:MAG: hypothetical protein COW64_13135 [bacterium (Candidatus Blackallbacteria) CG18_big_fil_WC_8_21_14_2_50_49_26]PIW18967.1 MAG: hypothetical protein COW36_02335 [bacterium (Candidatus Blackallbacteria) CG17_big_fil_post_rev_8_21_14_2_50_48_46]PIW44665.1 MAG: hypothetical protein COW20_23780 [bacterium (Candidatus Blackallbacteria) CG13_big_fil_rev_8_21_14_2_50_49_14]
MAKTDQILIVDDSRQNIFVLRTALERQGYLISSAESGQEALKILAHEIPDLILLDVMMPEISGFELCRKLKSQAETEKIPVVFLTARTEQEDILEGFKAGGVDYITKPFRVQELLARVNTHLSLRRAQEQISQQALQFEKQALKLEVLNQEKDELLAIVSHDLRSPLNAISGAAHILEENATQIQAEEISQYAQMVDRNAQRMRAIISNLLDIHRLENGKIRAHPHWFSVQELLEQIWSDALPLAKEKNLDLVLKTDPDLPTICTDPLLLREILDNLVSNALKFSPPMKQITLHADYLEPKIRLQVEDQGPGFSKEDQAHMYEKFAHLSARPTSGEHSTGLGLSIALRLSQLLQAQLEYVPQEGPSSTFNLWLPMRYQSPG